MPISSLQLRLPQYHAYISDPSSQLSRRYLTPSPNNEPRHSKIHRKMNIRKLLESLPERERDMDRDSDPECKIRAKRGYDRSGRSVMVFKRSGQGRKKKACGMPDCGICGVFWRMDIEDLERRVPGLVSEQVIPKKVVSERPITLRLRKRLCPSPAPSTAGSTTSTLTEFTEISELSQELLGHTFDSGLPTPSSTCSSATYCNSSASSVQSTPTKPSKKSGLHGPYGLPSPASSLLLSDFNGDSKLFRRECLPTSSSVSTLTEMTEHTRDSSIFNGSAPSVAVSSSAISTLTDFTELDTSSSLSTPPSSLSSIPPTLSTLTAITTTRSVHKTTKFRKHRSMIKMSDGTEWVPPTLERVQAYISSQGERRLAQSARLVVAKHAENGSRVGVKYEKAIRKVDYRAGVKPQTRAEILGPGVEEDEEGQESFEVEL